MRRSVRAAACLLLVCLLLAVQPALAAEVSPLPSDPTLTPDGQTVAFSWRGDLWTVPVAGGEAVRLTAHPDRDTQPRYSPDGKSLAWISNRDGSSQAYLMPAQGGPPRQLTFHTEGCSLEDWYPDGQAILVSARRDHHWRDAERFCRVRIDSRAAE